MCRSSMWECCKLNNRLCGAIQGNDIMAIGPVFECPYEMANSFEAVFAEQHIRVEGLNTPTNSAGFMKAFRFRGRLGSITGNQLNFEHHVLLWLTFPKYHA